MAEQSNIIGTLKGGLGLAGKLAGKGFSEVSGMLKSDESTTKGLSGVYWQRGPWSSAGDLLPEIDYMESQELGRFKVSIVKRVTTSKADRAFLQACGSCVGADSLGVEASSKETVESDPQYTDGYFMLGCYYLENHRPDEAVANFQKALLCQQSLGAKFKKYLPSLRMVLPLTPSSAIALYPDLLGLNVLLALSQRQAGQLEAAIITMQQLLGIMPTEPLALFFMAALRLESGQFGTIVEELRDVLPGSTLQIANLLLLGYACSKLGDVSTAREVYRSALEKNEYDPLMKLDLQYALATAVGGQGAGDVQAIYRDCPSYVPLFERLGLRLQGERPRTLGTTVAGGTVGTVAAETPSVTTSHLPVSAAPPSLPTQAVTAAMLTPTPSGAPASFAMPQPMAAPVAPIAPIAPALPDALSTPVAPQVDHLSAALPPLPFVPEMSSAPAPAASPATAQPLSAAVSAPASVVTRDMVMPAPSAANAPTASNTPALTNAGQGSAVLDMPNPVHTVEPLPPKVDGQTRLICAERSLEFVLSSAPFTVGREEGDCRLPFDGAVSRAHARITLVNGRYLVEDLHSTNGTWLNGYRLNGGSLYEVNRGDVVQFGLTKFRMV